jgi:peptidoglycan/LPS O-acetylase OafA/YrhL
LFWLHRAKVERFVNWGAIASVFALMMAAGWLTTGTRDGALWLPFLTGGQMLWGYSLVALLSGLLVARLSKVGDGGAVLRWLALLGFYSYEFYILHYPVREFSLRVFPETTLGNAVGAVVCFPDHRSVVCRSPQGRSSGRGGAPPASEAQSGTLIRRGAARRMATSPQSRL